ncbi:MAG: hypothetical protein ACRCST_16575 [Turicibacter sp.]
MSDNNVENNIIDKDKNSYHYYFPLFIGLGLCLGVALNQIGIGLCLGVSIGLILDAKKKK